MTPWWGTVDLSKKTLQKQIGPLWLAIKHVKDDWHVNFYKSEYGGLPCRIFSHSECDFIFLQSKDAKMLNEFYDDMTTMQKKRSTSFGRNK